MEFFIKSPNMKFPMLFCIVFTVSLSSGSGFVEEFQLFDFVNMTNVTDVVKITGKYANSSAYTFGADTSDIIVPSDVSAQITRQVSMIKDFTVKGYLNTSLENKPMAIISYYKKKTTIFNVIFSWLPSTEVKFVVNYQSEDNQQLQISSKITLEKVSKNDWLYFTVRAHIREKLIRFGVNDKFFAHATTKPFKTFPVDGILRLAQQVGFGNENIKKIKNQFVGDLQDIAIRFGDPSCNEVIAPVCPVTEVVSTKSKTSPTRPQGVHGECIGKNDIKHPNNEEWNEGQCVKCFCKMGKTYCVQFCKVCTHEGQHYLDEAEWDDTYCNRCNCKGGTVSCTSNGRVKRTNGCLRSCSDSNADKCPQKERDGCFCPGRQVFLNGKCKSRLSCPCQHGGKKYPPGYMGWDNCQFCRCSEGKYKCFDIC